MHLGKGLKPKQLYFILVVLTVLFLGMTIGGFIIARGRLNSKIADIKKLSGDITLANEQIERLQQLKTDYQKIVPFATKAQSILPAQKQQSEVVALISTLIASKGLELEGLSFDATKGLPDDKSQTLTAKIPGILIMPMRFKSSGNYEQLKSLLQSLERQRRYMKVSMLEITRGADDQILNFNLTVEVFLHP